MAMIWEKSSDQSSCLNLNLSFDLKLTTLIWTFFSQIIAMNWSWSELYELYTTLVQCTVFYFYGCKVARAFFFVLTSYPICKQVTWSCWALGGIFSRELTCLMTSCINKLIPRNIYRNILLSVGICKINVNYIVDVVITNVKLHIKPFL